jgi:hypothetical protein
MNDMRGRIGDKARSLLWLVACVACFILGVLTGAAFGQTTTYQTYGNSTYGSDGSTAQTYGNTTYYQPPNNQPQVVCQTYGSMTTCN